MPPELQHIRTWIFDLDNTLYPEASKLFDQIDHRMGAYISRLLGCDAIEARRVQKDHFHAHGTTLAGLIAENGIDPHEFLDFVHDIDLAGLADTPRLADRIAALPGRKLVFTNADSAYARRVLDALGLAELLSEIHDIHACALVPKPQLPAYHSLLHALSIDPATALFVEDSSRNLTPAKALGMTTVWLDTGADWGHRDHQPDSVDFHIHNLAEWLDSITQQEKASS